MKPTIRETIHTAIIMALTIAAGLIWKDVIIAAIEILVPPGEEIFYKFVGALFATVLVVLAIYIFVKTESEAEEVIEEVGRMTKRLRGRPAQVKPPDKDSSKSLSGPKQ